MLEKESCFKFKWHFLKKSGIILAFFGFMREFLVALNASFTSIIEKGLHTGVEADIQTDRQRD